MEKKYEARCKDRHDKTYGVWNNNMLSFQYINEWNGTETLDLEQAVEMADALNTLHEIIS